MRIKYLTIKLSYSDEATWVATHKEIKELLQMMNNLSRNAIILGIEQGTNPIFILLPEVICLKLYKRMVGLV